ncbi:MAG: efflux RND transporter permease subunit [Planctomycetota bacterium]|nr:efflux RND transporter permease subunit [Planctomycetota bacterium]
MLRPEDHDSDRSQLLQSNFRWNLSRWAVTHPAFVWFLMIASSIAGLAAYWKMGRAEDPTFAIKTVLVGAVWPGATADEMQRYVARRIEDKLRETPKLDFLLTYCIADRMMTLVQLKDSVRGRDVADTWYQVRKKLDDIRGELPSSLIGPTVDDEYGDVYSAVYAFTGDDYSLAELKRMSQEARKRLLKVNDVEKVDLLGNQQEQILLEFSHRKLATLGITPQQIFDSIARQNVMLRSGSIDTSEDRIHVRVDRNFEGIQQIEAVPLEASGRVFRLGDVAKVTRSYETPASFLIRFNGKPAVGLGVVMRKGGNVLELGKSLIHELELVRREVPSGVQIDTIAFQPRVVEASVGEFLNTFFEALIIVLIVSFLSLGLRTGIVVALSVPLVLSMSLVIMHSMGMNLDRITLGALILSLGLLVDDAIIAVEMMAVKMEQGWSRLDAATFAWTSTAFPMFSGTLITVAGFVPVGFARSTSGEYASGIFWVVLITLICSWIVAVLFTPLLGMRLLPNPPSSGSGSGTSHDDHHVFDTPFHRVLRRMIRSAVVRPWLVIATTFGLFLVALYGMSQLQQQFFPQSSRPELLVDVRMNEGSSIGATSQMLSKIEAKLEPWVASPGKTPEHSEPSALAGALMAGNSSSGPSRIDRIDMALAGDVQYYTSYVGAGAARFFLALNPDLPNPSFGKIVIQTSSIASRERLRRSLQETFRSDPEFSSASMRVLRLDFGPPVGYPVQFRIVGPDQKVVRQLADKVREIMRRNPSAVDVNLEYEEPAKTIQVKIDQDRARLLGLSPQEIELGLQTLLSGSTVSFYREGTETLPVVARAVDEERLDLDQFQDITLFTLGGKSVPLQQIGQLEFAQENPIVWQRNQEQILSVRCDIVDGVQAPDVSKQIDRELATLRSELPPGYRIDLGGSIEESNKANGALFEMFPIMILAMLTLLMAQVQNFRKMLLIFGIAPLGVIGAVASLHIFNAPFGFVALLGVIALAGMDMRNSVILVDQIEQDIRQGLSPWQAVIESSVRRARPVILTAATAILAMIPLTSSVFWGPMAMAIMGGLSIATFLTLINLPAIYVLLFRIKPEPQSDGV